MGNLRRVRADDYLRIRLKVRKWFTVMTEGGKKKNLPAALKYGLSVIMGCLKHQQADEHVVAGVRIWRWKSTIRTATAAECQEPVQQEAPRIRLQHQDPLIKPP